MNPNGFVAAASTTSQMSTPIARAIVLISFTSAMLTQRNVFSSSFAISAVRALETGCTFSMKRR